VGIRMIRGARISLAILSFSVVVLGSASLAGASHVSTTSIPAGWRTYT